VREEGVRVATDGNRRISCHRCLVGRKVSGFSQRIELSRRWTMAEDKLIESNVESIAKRHESGKCRASRIDRKGRSYRLCESADVCGLVISNNDYDRIGINRGLHDAVMTSFLKQRDRDKRFFDE
jgi:hypothetical protein